MIVQGRYRWCRPCNVLLYAPRDGRLARVATAELSRPSRGPDDLLRRPIDRAAQGLRLCGAARSRPARRRLALLRPRRHAAAPRRRRPRHPRGKGPVRRYRPLPVRADQGGQPWPDRSRRRAPGGLVARVRRADRGRRAAGLHRVHTRRGAARRALSAGAGHDPREAAARRRRQRPAHACLGARGRRAARAARRGRADDARAGARPA